MSPHKIARNKINIQNSIVGLPWWRSGWESACQYRGHGFEPWSGKIPHAAEQLGPWATTTEPACLEPVLCNKRGRNSERPAHHDEEWPPLAATREKPSHRNEDPTQPKIIIIIIIIIKKKTKLNCISRPYKWAIWKLNEENNSIYINIKKN